MPLRQNKVKALEEWCAENSIFFGEKICLSNYGRSGIGVFSKEDCIQPQHTLVRISKSSVLSARSCSLAGVITHASYGLAAQLSLSLALYVEMLKGEKSRWYGYLQSFPAGIVDLPMFWNLHLEANTVATGVQNTLIGRMCLTGTEAAKIRDEKMEAGGTILDEVTRFYFENAEPILLRHTPTGMNYTVQIPCLLDFYRAFSMVSSRAFLVDAYHGLAMVPIADAFNHVLENHVHLESDYSVCAECGSLYECAHDRDDWVPHKIELPVQLATETDGHDLYYEMVSNTEIPPHTEIFNTYGEHLSNAQLLNQYGFILDVNENDRLSWDIDDVLAVRASSLGSLVHPSRDSITLDLEIVVASLSADHAVFIDTQLIYHEASDGTMLFVNADGAVSHHLWALLFRLCTLDESFSGDILKLFSEVLALQIKLEKTDNENYFSDNEGEDMDAGKPFHFSRYSIKVLRAMCHFMVRLCATRKTNSGPEGFTEQQLIDILDTKVPEDDTEGRRIRLALSLLISEHSILDACAAAWTALAEAAAMLPEPLERTQSEYTAYMQALAGATSLVV